ncbi:type II toxin-antitoxin system RelE/ParE family toxin [Pendulispora rubella]|uniref:type II toxin-antitoxin system RelE/ParE family toxin n=1 Tax=Pendulispora rubella TaxID=2741070 RepID=UPI00374E0A29
MRVEFSASAQRDVEKHTAYLIERSSSSAARFVAELDGAFAHLLAHPPTGHRVALKQRKSHVRRWNIGDMGIFYDVRGEVLYVIRIRHSARRPITRT